MPVCRYRQQFQSWEKSVSVSWKGFCSSRASWVLNSGNVTFKTLGFQPFHFTKLVILDSIGFFFFFFNKRIQCSLSSLCSAFMNWPHFTVDSWVCLLVLLSVIRSIVSVCVHSFLSSSITSFYLVCSRCFSRCKGHSSEQSIRCPWVC